jgi:hypothetical protein
MYNPMTVRAEKLPSRNESMCCEEAKSVASRATLQWQMQRGGELINSVQ